jgi:hypothetical protein
LFFQAVVEEARVMNLLSGRLSIKLRERADSPRLVGVEVAAAVATHDFQLAVDGANGQAIGFVTMMAFNYGT